MKELWRFTGNRIVVRFEHESRGASAVLAVFAMVVAVNGSLYFGYCVPRMTTTHHLLRGRGIHSRDTAQEAWGSGPEERP